MPDQPSRPWTRREREWLERAAPTMQFICPKCGFLRTFTKTDEPMFYECPDGHEVDERSTYSRRRLARWDPF